VSDYDNIIKPQFDYCKSINAPIFARANLNVLRNDTAGVVGGYVVDITFLILQPNDIFNSQLNDEIQRKIVSKFKAKGNKTFPLLSTTATNPSKQIINLIPTYTHWCTQQPLMKNIIYDVTTSPNNNALTMNLFSQFNTIPIDSINFTSNILPLIPGGKYTNSTLIYLSSFSITGVFTGLPETNLIVSVVINIPIFDNGLISYPINLNIVTNNETHVLNFAFPISYAILSSVNTINVYTSLSRNSDAGAEISFTSSNTKYNKI
jgi:hypothetical protein